MYCTHCAAPLSPGLSYCNRCGASLREKEPRTSNTAIPAFLTAITLLAAIGLGIMLGGALALRKEAGLSQELIGVFMLFVFLITSVSEVMLIRMLSRLTGSIEHTRPSLPPQQVAPYELRPAQGEPVASVTENTTRTLEYARRERNNH